MNEMNELFSDYDLLILDSMGVTIPTQRTRSSWTPERVLQEAADGNITSEIVGHQPGNLVERRIYISGEVADQAECDALGDLLASGQVTIVCSRIVMTSEGRTTLDTWSRYAPISRKRGER